MSATGSDAHLVEVSDEQVEFFREHGYVAFDRITTDEELDWLRDVFDELFATDSTTYFDVMRPLGSSGPPVFPQTLFPEVHHPELRDSTYVANARHIAARLLDEPEDRLTNWGHMLDKPPGRGHQAPWHQDEAYWEPELQYHAVGAWMPLDDTDVDNGCLWFLPGSHLGGVLPHQHLGGDPRVHGLELVEAVDTSDAVPVPMRAGGVSFHHPRTLHFSRPNTTDRPRRAYANEFQTAPERRDRPADRPWVEEGRRAAAAIAAENQT
jgi:ectoine hydroxylase-related dioxygenase (phytanoyl-CoA dioxygenase family)